MILVSDMINAVYFQIYQRNENNMSIDKTNYYTPVSL